MPAARVAVLVICVATGSCTPTLPDAEQIGDPVPGLTSDELARFEAGRALFDRVFTIEEGVGPLFNENQCSACHTFPATGGTGEQLVIKATRRRPDGTCDIMAEEGGENLRRQATPAERSSSARSSTAPDRRTLIWERRDGQWRFIHGDADHYPVNREP